MYLTYDRYVEKGGACDAALFPRICEKATRLIDRMTHGRLIGETPGSAVEYCAFELIEAMREDEQSAGISGRGIAAMTNDDVSVTFDAGAGSRAASRYESIVFNWLDGEETESGVNLLYAGVDE